MSDLIESKKLDDPEFKWGKKGKLGGKNNNVQFYKSFTYDGEDYKLYDCVYMYKQGEPAPYIGKLVKMWETPGRINRIKVQWFFRPSEISYYLKDTKVLENEVFFASGDGIGLADPNPLEAIAGKCNIVCTSMDKRNPQPSAEELQMADYVFYRIFDVTSCTISDEMDDIVGGLKVTFVFNRREGVETPDSPKLDYSEKYEGRNVVACEQTLNIAGNGSTQELNDVKLDENSYNILEEEDRTLRQVPVNEGSLVGKHSSSVDAISSRNREISGITLEEKSTMGAKNIENNIREKKDKSMDRMSPVSMVQVEKGMKKYARKFCDADDAPSKRRKVDGSFSSDSTGTQGPSVPRYDAAHLSTGATTSKGKLKSGLVKDSVGCRKDVGHAKNSNPLDEKLPKTTFSKSKEASGSGHAEGVVGLQKDSKSNGDTDSLSKPKALFAENKNLGSAQRNDSFVAEKNKKLGGKLSSCGDKSSNTNVVSSLETQRPSTNSVLPNQTPKSVPNKELEGSGKSEKPIQSSSTKMERSVEISAPESKEKSNLRHDKSSENNEESGLAAKPLQSVSTSRKGKLEISVEESKEKPNLVHDKSCGNKNVFGQASKPLQISPTSKKRVLEISAHESKEKLNLGRDKSFEKEHKLVGSSYHKDEGHIKKAKLDNSIKQLEVNKSSKINNSNETNSLFETKNSPKCATSSDNVKSRSDGGPSNVNNSARAKINVGEMKNSPKYVTPANKERLRLGEGSSKVHRNEKDGKLLNDNLPNPRPSKCKDDGEEVRGKIIDVTPRPPDKPTWMKLSWDELMKTAHDQGRLVLLQNLDPQYTSGEIEDIIWHVFRENCEARMVPHCAISNPYSGQAFVVFKTRAAANKVVQKLDDECLMLPNQRPLVACRGVLPKSSEKHSTFVGHLAIDRGRRQMQRDMKEAVSTSHYSQHNTIEFSMAMEWRLLQLQSDIWWRELHEIQRKELEELEENLKSK